MLSDDAKVGGGGDIIIRKKEHFYPGLPVQKPKILSTKLNELAHSSLVRSTLEYASKHS